MPCYTDTVSTYLPYMRRAIVICLILLLPLNMFAFAMAASAMQVADPSGSAVSTDDRVQSAPNEASTLADAYPPGPYDCSVACDIDPDEPPASADVHDFVNQEAGIHFARFLDSTAMPVLPPRFSHSVGPLVVLCLSFLLMIGLSLVAEGLGFHIPKGYLYAAIGFSILIETLNQFARRNFLKSEARVPLRDRTADTVLRLMGGKKRVEPEADAQDEAAPEPEAFGAEERNMVSGVLTLADRSVRSIMTPRSEMSWVNLDDDADTILGQLQDQPHSRLPVGRGQLDNLVGIAATRDLVSELLLHGRIDETTGSGAIRKPILIPDTAGVLKAMETLKRAHGQLVLVSDEFGIVQGLLTPVDILEAIAGEFPDEDEQLAVRATAPGTWEVDGGADLHQLEQVLETDGLVSADADYTSLAGFLLARFDRLPATGDVTELDGLRYTVLEVDERRIIKVAICRVEAEPGVGKQP